MSVEPHSITLSIGRVVEFYDYDYTPPRAGDYTTSSEPAEVSIGDDACWSDTGIRLTERELESVDGDPAIIDYLVALEDAAEAAVGDDEISAEPADRSGHA